MYEILGVPFHIVFHYIIKKLLKLPVTLVTARISQHCSKLVPCCLEKGTPKQKYLQNQKSSKPLHLKTLSSGNPGLVSLPICKAQQACQVLHLYED